VNVFLNICEDFARLLVDHGVLGCIVHKQLLVLRCLTRHSG
jgi:hypothetical protein